MGRERLGKAETMRVQNLSLVFPALPVHIPQDSLGYRMAALAWESLIPFCNSPVSASSSGLPVSAPMVTGKECSPSRTGKGHRGQRGRRGRVSSVLLPPLADEGNAHQHRDKNRLVHGGN